MKRTQIALQPTQIKLLLTIQNLPDGLKEKLESSDLHQATEIFTNEYELEKTLDLLPPPHLSTTDELEVREFLAEVLRTLT
jgi:hypothetical protein